MSVVATARHRVRASRLPALDRSILAGSRAAVAHSTRDDAERDLAERYDRLQARRDHIRARRGKTWEFQPRCEHCHCWKRNQNHKCTNCGYDGCGGWGT